MDSLTCGNWYVVQLSAFSAASTLVTTLPTSCHTKSLGSHFKQSARKSLGTDLSIASWMASLRYEAMQSN
jgi:hypothetical protein